MYYGLFILFFSLWEKKLFCDQLIELTVFPTSFCHLSLLVAPKEIPNSHEFCRTPRFFRLRLQRFKTSVRSIGGLVDLPSMNG